MDDQESLEITAKTVREATDRALERLGRRLDEVIVTVLSEGRSGILGIGGEDARILVSVKEPVPSPAISNAGVASLPSNTIDSATPAETDETDPVETGQRVLESLLLRMRIFADVDIVERESGPVLNVVGDDLGLLIGRRGNTLSALQFITNMIVARRVRKWSRLTVDVEDYRVRREQTLRGVAQRMAERVQQTGQPFALEAMPASERRIVHMTLAHHPYVTTASIGEGEDRKVVISPKR
jgi:spoIIIJ-associated protein